MTAEYLFIADIAVATLLAIAAIIALADTRWRDGRDVAFTLGIVGLALWSPARLLWIEFAQLVVAP